MGRFFKRTSEETGEEYYVSLSAIVSVHQEGMDTRVELSNGKSFAVRNRTVEQVLSTIQINEGDDGFTLES